MGLRELIHSGFTARQSRQLLAELPVGGGGGAGVGGGAFGGVTQIAHTTFTPTLGASSRALFSGWSQSSPDGQPHPGVTFSDANFQFTPTDAGFYQLRAYVNLAFTAGTDPFPDAAWLQWSSYTESVGNEWALPLSVLGGTNDISVAAHGFDGNLVSSVFYQPAATIVGDASGIKPTLCWKGNATATAGFRSDLPPQVIFELAKVG